MRRYGEAGEAGEAGEVVTGLIARRLSKLENKPREVPAQQWSSLPEKPR